MKSKEKSHRLYPCALVSVLLASIVSTVSAQNAPVPAATTMAEEEEPIVLSPFVVDASQDQGYAASTTLAGTRLRTNLADIGTSISVLTKEFMDDIGGTDSASVLSYATNMEVVGTRGNFLNAGTGSFGNNDETSRMLNPAGHTRVRGLVRADNTRNYFRTNVGWDGFNVGRIDLLRGANGLLFGLGSPGGVVNASTDRANLQRDSGELGIASDQFGSYRATLQYNKVIAEDQLALRGALLHEEGKFRQDHAYEDKRRQFVTATYKPSLLNKSGMSFEISADYEQGDTRSNRPRLAPPIDSFSPYVTGMTIRDIQLPAGTNFLTFANGVIPGGTFSTPGYQVNQATNYSGALPAGIVTSFDGNGIRYIIAPSDLGISRTSAPYWGLGKGGAYGVYNSNGSINTNAFAGSLFGANYNSRLVGTLNNYAAAIGHPFAAAFGPTSLTDSSVFDFYNTLIDGPNKREWSDFDQLRLVVSNTFLDQKIGYEISHYRESSEFGQTNLLSDNSRIMVDINAFLPYDPNPRPNQAPNYANPNVGRAYVQETDFAGNRISNTDLEATRVSAFVDYDFQREDTGPEWLQWVLGRQVFNAAWMQDESDLFTRSFQRHVYPDDLLVAVGRINANGTGQRFNNNTRTAVQYYISDNLTGLTSLSGANFSALTEPILDNIPPTITVRVFDPTWIAGDLAKNAVWVNPLGANSTQSANPANYIGWVNKEYRLIDALSGSQVDLDLATRQASLQYSEVESKILSWQGYLLDGALVGTYGWREDTSLSKQRPAPGRADGGANVDPALLNYGHPDTIISELKTRSKNYSLVAHLNRLPRLDRLPLQVSLTYNKGENFDPTAGRINKLNEPLPPPSGTTEEYGVVFATKDSRYILKVAKYETTVLNAGIGAVPGEFLLQQILGNNGAVAAYNASAASVDPETGMTVLEEAYAAQTTPPGWSIADQRNIHAPAWYAMESALQAQFPGFVDRWLTPNNGGTFAPSNQFTTFGIGGTNTGDTVSKGYEIEFTANPNRELRLTFNASKTEAVVDNAPGAGTIALYEFLNDALWDGDTLTAAGALRDGFGPFGVNGTLGETWRNGIWRNYLTLRQLNGQRRPELVKWRFNALANYTFREGRFKGLGLGAAYRWEDDRSVGYPLYFDDLGVITADIARPITGPKSDRVDLTLSYGRKLFEWADWRIQLNVYNVLGENKLVPSAANPDGTFSLYRIQEGTSWRLSNTFHF